MRDATLQVEGGDDGAALRSEESSRVALGSGLRTGGEGQSGRAARGGKGRAVRGGKGQVVSCGEGWRRAAGQGQASEVRLVRFGVETGGSEAGKRVGRSNGSSLSV